jgi:putative peptidoglycan lipid II flippase
MLTAPESPSPGISERRVLKGGLVVAAGLLLAQLAGFIRQAAIGYLLGTGPQADALSAAMAPVEIWWTILNIAVIYGFVPKFSEHAPGGESRFADILKPMSRLAAVSSLCFFLFARPAVRLFAPGLDAGTAALATDLLRVASLAPAAVGCTFVYMALLLSRRRFVLPSFHHAAVNLITILTALLFHARLGVFSFVIGFSAGAWIQLALTHLYSRKLIAGQTAPARDLHLIDLLRGPAPVLGQALAVELNTAVSRAFASTFGLGMTAAFDYGFRVFRVPLALLVVPLSQSLLPEISSLQRSAGERRAALRAAVRAAWLTAAAGAGVMVCMMVFRDPIVHLLFERGAFGRSSTEAVAMVLLGYMPVIVGRGLCEFLSRSLFGMGRFRVPLSAAVAALLVNAAVCALLPNRWPVLIGLGATAGFVVGGAWVVAYVRRLSREA